MVKIEDHPQYCGLGFSHTSTSFSLGKWDKDLLNGLGIRIYKGKHLFFGDWDSGKWHGQGTVLSATPETGGLYIGHYFQSMSHGYGFKRWANGASYSGEWKNNRISGQGTYKWATGSVYEGSWEENERNGFGTYNWPNGSRYVGEWKKNNFHGEGTKFYENGDTFKGAWENDYQSGKGQYETSFGAKYEGNYENGKKHGTGTFYHPDGYNWTGNWINNIPSDIEGALHPKLKESFANNKCSRSVTGLTPFFAQILQTCLTCRDGYWCQICVKGCHHGMQHSSHQIEMVWSFQFCQNEHFSD